MDAQADQSSLSAQAILLFLSCCGSSIVESLSQAVSNFTDQVTEFEKMLQDVNRNE